MDVEKPLPFEQFNTFDTIDVLSDEQGYQPLMTLNSLTELRGFKKYYRVDGHGRTSSRCMMCMNYIQCYHDMTCERIKPDGVQWPKGFGEMQMGVCNTCWMEGRMSIPMLQPRYTKEIQESALNGILIQDVLNIVIEYASLDTQTMIYLPYDVSKLERFMHEEYERDRRIWFEHEKVVRLAIASSIHNTSTTQVAGQSNHK